MCDGHITHMICQLLNAATVLSEDASSDPVVAIVAFGHGTDGIRVTSQISNAPFQLALHQFKIIAVIQVE